MNEEKVVNPPQNPIIRAGNQNSSLINLPSFNESRTPIKKQPRTLQKKFGYNNKANKAFVSEFPILSTLWKAYFVKYNLVRLPNPPKKKFQTAPSFISWLYLNALLIDPQLN